MADQLKNIVAFTVPAGGTVSLPHNLHVAMRALIPDYLVADVAGLVLTADDTNITAVNPTTAPITADVLAEAWHTIERAFGAVGIEHLNPQPFIPAEGGGGGGGGPVVTDGITIEGDGTAGFPIQIDAVQHDASLIGAGTVASPLSVVGAPAMVFTDNVTIQGDGTGGNPVEIKAVQHDATLVGAGTVASPLSVVGGGAGSAVLAFGDFSIGAFAGTVFLDQWGGGLIADPFAEISPIVVPRAGTLKNLIARHTRAAGINNVKYVVRVNGVNTALNVTLAAGAIGQASDLVHSIPVNQGDRVTLSAVKSLPLFNGDVNATISMELA